jgi:hypothetical protein
MEAGSMRKSNSGTRIGFMAMIAVAATVAALTAPSIASAGGDANEAFCPTETESSPGFRVYLPDCRAYELVTPPYKESGILLSGLTPSAISPDGNRLITSVGGAFAGAGNAYWQGNVNPNIDAYELTRTASGWQPTALTPPATTYPHSHIMAASQDLGATLWGATTNNVFTHPPGTEDVYVRTDTGEFDLVGPGVGPELAGEETSANGREELRFAGSSHNLGRLLFSAQAFENFELALHHGHGDLWPGDTTTGGKFSLYEYVGTGNAEPTLVGVKNDGPLHGEHHVNEGAELISRCGTELGFTNPSFGLGSAYNAVSASGETVFFTAHECSEGPGEPEANELYARLGAVKTLAISSPPASAYPLSQGEGNGPDECNSACHAQAPKEGIFRGASEDGSKVFFETRQPLLNEDEDAANDLYEAEIEGEGASAHLSHLVQVSHDPNSGEAAAVQGVVRVSEDGSHVYFVAEGKLTGPNSVAGRNPEEAEPQAGADNLYVYEPDPAHPGQYRTVFLATILTPPEESTLQAAEAAELSQIEARALSAYLVRETLINGELERGEITESRHEELITEANNEYGEFITKTEGTEGPHGTLGTDREVWRTEDSRPAQATPDGRYLLFTGSAHLTPGDTSTVPQLFRYDAQEEALTRVSVGQAGFNRDGNVEAFSAAPRIPEQTFLSSDLPTAAQYRLAISEDGSAAFFTSTAALTPQAEAGATNVYEYRAGDVYLVSDGHDASKVSGGIPTVEFFGANPSAADAFFTTADQLVPQAAESQQMLYDARTGGGFPASATQATCEGEVCQGPTSVAPATQSPGSASFSGPGNLTSPPSTTTAAAASKSKPLTRAQKLAQALKACRKGDKPKKKQAACERQARTRYATKTKAKAKKSNRRGK